MSLLLSSVPSVLTLGVVVSGCGVQQQQPLIGHNYKVVVPYPSMYLCVFRPQPPTGSDHSLGRRWIGDQGGGGNVGEK